MSVLAALVLALLGALGTSWIIWLRREHERDTDMLAQQIAALSTEIASLRSSVESTRSQLAQLRAASDSTRAELAEFVHGPPSMRRPTASG